MSTRNLYCIIGPSGSGKSTLASGLTAHGYREVISHTTRACRGGKDIDSYHFVTRTEFELFSKSGIFFEYVEYAGNLYGTSFGELAMKDFILVDIEGYHNFRRNYTARPVKGIGLSASEQELRRRLSSRSDESLKRVEVDKSIFANLRAEVDLYIEGATPEDTLTTVLGFIATCEQKGE